MKDQRGLYDKFRVERVDGSSAPGGKHEGCDYFVLDLTHDPFAMNALRVYALACSESHPVLSRDLCRKYGLGVETRIVSEFRTSEGSYFLEGEPHEGAIKERLFLRRCVVIPLDEVEGGDGR